MPNHSPEPWRVGEQIIETTAEARLTPPKLLRDGRHMRFYNPQIVSGLDDVCPELTVYEHDEAESNANLHRIVACVNALAGLNPAAVPKLVAVCEQLVCDYYLPYSCKPGEVMGDTVRLIADAVALAKEP